MSCMVLFEHELDHQTCAKNQGQFTRLPLSSLGDLRKFSATFSGTVQPCSVHDPGRRRGSLHIPTLITSKSAPMDYHRSIMHTAGCSLSSLIPL